MWSGGQANERIKLGLIALIASLSFGVLLIIIAITYLVLELATVVFALAAPIFFLIGLVPVYGFKIFLRWVEAFLGAFPPANRHELFCWHLDGAIRDYFSRS